MATYADAAGDVLTSYRVRAVSTDTNTVLYDSQLVGSTLVLEGCSDSAVVNVPAPAPQAECVAGGQHGPWTRIDLATPTSGVLPACVSGELVMEARDACGNFLSEINSPASWLNSDPTALSLFPAIGFTDLDFHAGYAKVRFVSNNSIQPTLTVVAGGLVSPSARLTIERSNTLSHLQIVPYTILAVGPDYGILCVGGYPNPPYVEVQAVTACSDLFVPSEPIQVFLKSSEGLFPAVELSLTAANNGRATYTLPTIPTALEEDTFQANGADGLLSAPIRLLFERDCASAGI